MPLECAHDPGALDGIVDLRIGRIDVLRKLAFLQHPLGGILERVKDVLGRDAKPRRDRFGEALGVVGKQRLRAFLERDEPGIGPEWHAVAAPAIGAAARECGVAANGMWPSAQNTPEVGSSPIQPAPGRYTSAQACRAVKSCSGPDGPSRDFKSGRSWMR